MWTLLTGSLLDVRVANGATERFAADFMADATDMTLKATTTDFVGPGSAPSEIYWRADGPGWILLPPSTRISGSDDDHDFFDLPKLLWPRRYAPLAEVCEGNESTVILSQEGSRLLGNGRASRVTATVDRGLGVIRSYRSQDADGATLRTVELTLTAR